MPTNQEEFTVTVGDLISVADCSNESDVYRIVGVYLGVMGQDSVVELEPLTLSRASIGATPSNSFVPLQMLYNGVARKAFEWVPS